MLKTHRIFPTYFHAKNPLKPGTCRWIFWKSKNQYIKMIFDKYKKITAHVVLWNFFFFTLGDNEINWMYNKLYQKRSMIITIIQYNLEVQYGYFQGRLFDINCTFWIFYTWKIKDWQQFSIYTVYMHAQGWLIYNYSQ